MKTIKAKVHRLPAKDKAYHLYITTDEEIKEGDWVLDMDNEVYQVKDNWKDKFSKYANKIIATTDLELMKYVGESYEGTIIRKEGKNYQALPQIPQSFIEEYCKAGGIDEVLVEVESTPNPIFDDMPNVIYNQRLKLNPDNTIIIHPVEEKMHTLKQIKHMFDIGRDSAFQEMHFDEAIKYRDNELNKMD